VSAVEGLDPLRVALRDALRARRPEIDLLIPLTDGKLLAEAHRYGEVLASDADEDAGVMRIRGRFDAAALARLERDGASRG
jgi:GTP-binding protein HflX